MLLCQVVKPSAAISVQCLNSVQLRANRLRLVVVTCSLRNPIAPLYFARICSGYAYNTAYNANLQTGCGRREENRNIFRDSSMVETGQLSHLERAYMSDVAQGTFSNTNSNYCLSYPSWVTNRKIFRRRQLGFLLSSHAICFPTTAVPMRSASSTATQPKRDTGAEEHTTTNLKENTESSTPAAQRPQGLRPEPQPENGKPSKTQQLKKVFKEYGAVGVSFHVAISLMSLGIFYLAVSSGLDMAAVLYKVGFSESVVQSRLAAGTSTFVLAYAVHKLFAPVRISITLVSVPLIVRYFRKTGLFKPPASSP